MKRTVLFWIALLSAGLSVSATYAQGLDLVSGDGNDPITVDAKGGIEWNQNEQLFIASGPARATRGDMVLDADEMRAHYRPSPSGSSEVYRLDAIGHVRITTPGRVATGEHAVYDVDKSVIILKDGNPVTLTAGEDVITTEGQLEFWDLRNLAVARGAAKAVRADKRIAADVITAHFVTDSTGKNALGRVEAFDNVVITTATEQAFSDRAAYNVPTGLARLTGSVKIKRGDNIINGCSADVDLNSGVSRMNSCEGESVSGQSGSKPTGSNSDAGKNGGARVHGVLTPKQK